MSMFLIWVKNTIGVIELFIYLLPGAGKLQNLAGIKKPLTHLPKSLVARKHNPIDHLVPGGRILCKRAGIKNYSPKRNTKTTSPFSAQVVFTPG